MTLQRLLFTLLLLSGFLSSIAQITPKLQGDGRITGNLLDSTSKSPIEFATLALYSVSDLKQPIDGTVTDDKGKFVFKNIPNGKYAIKFSSIGYNDKTMKLAEITDKNYVFHLGNIKLGSNEKQLKEIVLTGQASVIEEKVDRLVYNADKDIGSKGGDAADILRKVPLLTVDLDGTPSLRGSTNIKVLINNKPSTMIAASITDALKQIPADQIKTVEVITSPSSKYDAEGTTGIINIILKKNNLEGYSLNTDLAAGNRGGNLGLNGSLRQGKFGMTLGGFGRLNINPSKTKFEQTTLGKAPNFETLQNGSAKDHMIFGRYSLGADYDLTKNKSLSAGIRFGTRSFNRNEDKNILNGYNLTLSNEQILRTTAQNINTVNPNLSYDLNLDYLHIIKPQQEFSISTLYSRNDASNNFVNTPLNVSNSDLLKLASNNNSHNQEFTLQTDYQTPIRKNQLLEFGLKGIFRIVNSDYYYQRGGVNIYEKAFPTGFLNYNQNIAATYFSYTYTTKNKFTFKAGTRFEQTSINANQENKYTDTTKHQLITNNTKVNVPGYGLLVPSINMSKTFKGLYTWKMGYTQRITRPGLQQLNPNRNMTNPSSFSEGNPTLKPEISHNIETSISASIKKVYLNVSFFNRITNNSITQITDTLSSKISLISFQNIGKNISYGTNINGNISVTSKWMINGGMEAYYNFISGTTTGSSGTSQTISNQGWNMNARLMSMTTLKNGWQVQGFGMLRGSTVQTMGRQSGFGFYSLGFKKDFKNKKGSFGLSAQNFLTNYIALKSTVDKSLLLSQVNTNYMYNRGISANLSFKLGNMGVEAPKKRAKGVKNDDVKDGESGGSSTPAPAGGATRN